MSDLHDTDVITWAEQQALSLRARSANELDWDNLAEEIEALVRTEVRAVTGPLIRAMQHKLLLLGWPNVSAVRHWEHEVRILLAQAHKAYLRSMAKDIEPVLEAHYREAVLLMERHMLRAGPPATPSPASCPWTLAELLAEGEAALQPKVKPGEVVS